MERFFVDPTEPRVALAAVAGPGAHILRTTNSGGFWDDLTGNLSDAPAHGITADRATGVVYAATDKGVFFARADLENAGSPAVTWMPLDHAASGRAGGTTSGSIPPGTSFTSPWTVTAFTPRRRRIAPWRCGWSTPPISAPAPRRPVRWSA